MANSKFDAPETDCFATDGDASFTMTNVKAIVQQDGITELCRVGNGGVYMCSSADSTNISEFIWQNLVVCLSYQLPLELVIRQGQARLYRGQLQGVIYLQYLAGAICLYLIAAKVVKKCTRGEMPSISRLQYLVLGGDVIARNAP